MSGLWMAATVLTAVLSYDFSFVRGFHNEPGPALVMLLFGIAAIWIFCLGVPWVIGAAIRR